MDLIKIDEITTWRKRQKYGWGTRSEVRNELIVLCKVVRFFSSPTDMCLLTEDLRQACVPYIPVLSTFGRPRTFLSSSP